MFNSYFPPTARWPWVAAALLGLLLLGRPSHAQVYNTAGTTLANTGIFSTTGDFQNLGTFVPTSGTFTINSGNFLNTGTITSLAGGGTVALVAPTGARTLALNGASLPSLALNVPAGTTMSNSGTILTAVTFTAGLLNTGANTLTLASAAVVNNEANGAYVVGRLSQAQSLTGSTVVDFGKTGLTANPNGQSFTPTVERRAGLNLANVSYGQNPGVAGYQSIDRVWSFTGGGTTGSNVTLVLSWLSDNDNGRTFSAANTQVWRSVNNGTSWAKQDAVGNGSARSMTINTTLFNNVLYTVSTITAPLPVELVAFTAAKVANDGQLSWQTASEQNTAFMEVQASTTGRDWTVLGQVAAAGNSSRPLRYAFLDRNLSRYQAAQVYYRLRLVDRDGPATYSPLVSLTPNTGPAFALSAWPNPFGAGELAVELATPQAGDLSLVVYDAVGRLVLQRTFGALAAGTQTLRLDDAADLPAGSYTLVARQGDQRAAVHLVRQ